MNNRFPKSQRLCSRYLIDKLFEPGCSKSIAAYPLRVVFMTEEASTALTPETQLLISVPKRCFKHAVDRNRVKRQIREAYRTNRQLLALPDGQRASLAVIWLDNKHYPSSVVTAKVQNLLTRISEKLRAEVGEKLKTEVGEKLRTEVGE